MISRKIAFIFCTKLDLTIYTYFWSSNASKVFSSVGLATLTSSATIFTLSHVTVSLSVRNVAFSRINVHTLSQNRYVCKWP